MGGLFCVALRFWQRVLNYLGLVVIEKSKGLIEVYLSKEGDYLFADIWDLALFFFV